MEKLDSFFAEKTITDVDRTKFLPYKIEDYRYKLTTCLVFNCNCHSYEDPTIIPCEYTGAVIHLPAFWVEVPKELTMSYILGLLKDLYDSTYSDWYRAGLIGGIGNNGGNNTPSKPGNPNCPCQGDGWNNV